MRIDIASLLRPHLRQLQPYTSARDEYSGSEGVFLDANENPFGSSTSQDFNRYPDPYQTALKQEIAKIKGANPAQIFLGNGSDEAIDLLFRAFCNPGQDNVILLPPTYGMYGVSAAINGVEVRNVPLTPDFQLQPEKILSAVNAHSKILFLCSPNNPSGNAVKREDILFLLENFPGIVVVDEAYIDFSEGASLLTVLDQHPNLLVMQTLSKAWGLASLRLGMAFASPELIRVLNQIKPPYNISGLTQETVLSALQNKGKVDEFIQLILEERKFLQKELERLPYILRVHNSDANFLLVQFEHPNQVYEDLVKEKIIVRNRSSVLHCAGCLRITVGTREESIALLQALEKVCQS
ncbi:MAG: histidinol-phosphate transaminase [Algoriphagus sp.]|uniref:histidinol-phosphate transaminase n=1 Tax=Algoriphagus sp. TaxID=1872435 RepID=UPI00274DFDE5|nr:histidinol-phosphate transaminase [Algoriphagus sp.]MDP4748129.1 histidinol-phosphate transaminase [Algoriphagus sp.]MDP4839523.1 histidinol-phosphate transaminase [Algoriphagus sp.]MDP4956190.1 histidinol-phosphate transaminase [Algoriphagus sp.]MDP5124712.1 histidinol-phosphate transaminase [Algoriphagus sp.]